MQRDSIAWCGRCGNVSVDGINFTRVEGGLECAGCGAVSPHFEYVRRAAQPEADRAPELRLCQACGEHLEQQLRVEGDLPQSPDRAPGEVEAVARALAELHGGIYEVSITEREWCWKHAQTAVAALDALHSEQGQSRDDTVTLSEVLESVDRMAQGHVEGSRARVTLSRVRPWLEHHFGARG